MVSRLRGQGPKTFISYAFGNSLALRLARQLTAEGFQVALPDDTFLLGQPSLRSALESYIRDAEVVVPVLDRKANRSQWVQRELEAAVKYQRLVLPVVQDRETLPGLVKDIPYLTERNIDALIPAALSKFALLPLDPAKPYQLLEGGLRKYLTSETEYVRVILDSDNLTGQLAKDTAATAEQANLKQPDLRRIIEQQVLTSIEHAVRMMDQAQLILPQFRTALEAVLVRWGAEGAERANWSSRVFQRLTRLLVGLNLLNIGETLPPTMFPGYWRGGGEAVGKALAETRNEGLSYCPQDKMEQWVLTLRSADGRYGWFEVVFESSKGNHFRGYFPDRGDLREMAQRYHARPEEYIDSYWWADFGLPQLLTRAARLAARFSDSRYLESIVWTLADYESSGVP